MGGAGRGDGVSLATKLCPPQSTVHHCHEPDELQIGHGSIHEQLAEIVFALRDEVGQAHSRSGQAVYGVQVRTLSIAVYGDDSIARSRQGNRRAAAWH